jgi:5-methyltetrahydrofolate--homocysteine methyltransferase
MTAFLERLRSGDILIADGATGTNHQQNGLPPGAPSDEWVFDEPDKVKALHRAFVKAGSDIILTDTFNGTRLRLRESKYADRSREINERAAQLAREVAEERPGVFVAGSMGPIGKLLQPLGELAAEECAENFAEQAAALTKGGVDFLLLETQFALEEALAAIKGIKSVSQLPLVVSFSYDQGKRTMMGLRPAQVALAIAPLGVAAIGANCGKAPAAMEEIVKEYAAQNLDLPIWAKPNAGLPHLIGDREVYDATPEIMAAYAVKYVQAGARIVGGCCGNTPAHIEAIATSVNSYRKDAKKAKEEENKILASLASSR